MGSERRAGADGDSSPWTEDPTFTSQAYAADNDEAATLAASTWLEQQSLFPFIREVAARSLARLAMKQGEAILEVGCGTGVFLPALAALVGPTGRVVGLDHSAAFLAQARERIEAAGFVESIELLEGDAHRLPFAAASFDAAHAERVFMHLEDPVGALAEVVRVVRPGGRVVVAEVFAQGATVDHPDVEAMNLINSRLVSGIRNGRMGLQLRGLFVEAGLVDVDGDIVGYFEPELDQDEAEEIARISRRLSDDGVLDAERAEAVIAELEDRRARGVYCGLALIFVVSGRKPEDPGHGG